MLINFLHVLLVLVAHVHSVLGVSIDQSKCSKTKVCLQKPHGCNPQSDCTVSVNFYVDEENSLHIQMMAQALIPPEPLQYIAIGFSNDKFMGDDLVIECVLSTDAGFIEPEVFASFNHGKTNDRIYLPEEDRRRYIHNITGEITDGRLYCEFSLQIIPQIPHDSNQLWSLNRDYYILATTGTAQPDELNAHDTSTGSHFYPLISNDMKNPSRTGEVLYDLTDYLLAAPNSTNLASVITTRDKSMPSTNPVQNSLANFQGFSLVLICCTVLLFLVTM